MYKVTVRSPDGSETHYPLGADQGLIIGRDEGADIILDSKRVSRRHARLYTSGTQLHIEDLESQNGVFVGGARITGTSEFRAGPPIEIGEFTLRVKREDPLAPENSYAGQLHGYGPWEGKTLQLPREKGIVGRDATADMTVESESVSRRHAEIRYGGAQGYFVQDLGSSNGTFINGARLPANVERPLRPNDRLNFGDTGWLVTPQTAQDTKAESTSNFRRFLLFVVAAVIVLGGILYVLDHIPKTVVENREPPPTGPSAIDKCQQSIADQNPKWAEAVKECSEAYDEEPFVERRGYLRQAKREANFKAIFDSCESKAQVGSDRDAIECFFGIDMNSWYFPKAKLEVHQLAARLLKTDEVACRAAVRQKNNDKIVEHCREYLRYQCHNGVDKELQPPFEKALAAKKLKPFECPSEISVWFKTGVTERYRREDYCDKNEDPSICDALLAFAQKKPTADVLRLLGKAAPKNAQRVDALKEGVSQVAGEYGQGMSAAQGNKWTTDADKLFREVMERDARIMKQGMESDYVKDIRVRMGDHFLKAGDDAQSDKHYDDAFKAYMMGLYYRPQLELKLQGLERVAAEMLAGQPTCDRLPTIKAFTRPESAEYQEADKRFRENCK